MGVREIVNKRGNYGIRGLARSFKIMDDGGDGQLDREDFKWGLYDYGVHLNDEQFNALLDKDGSGQVTKSDIAVAYDCSEHPEVIAGTMTEDEVITEFMEQWETQEADGIITRAEFEDYYKDVS